MLSDGTIRSAIEAGELGVEGARSLEDQIQPAGLDLRIGSSYKPEPNGRVISAKSDPRNVLQFEPDTFYRVHTAEAVDLPDDLSAFVFARSSVAHGGLSITSGPVHPGFEGVLELGVYNMTDEVIPVEAGSLFVQMMFMPLDQAAETPYGETESSQYQGQEGL